MRVSRARDDGLPKGAARDAAGVPTPFAALIRARPKRVRDLSSLANQIHFEYSCRMLPAWATVLVALGVGFIGALAGLSGSYLAYRGTSLTVSSQVDEAWRTRLIEASLLFVESYTAVVLKLGDQLFDEGAPVLDDDRRNALDAAWSGLLKAQIRVDLLFGGHKKPVGEAAEKVIESISEVVGVVEARPDFDESDWEEKQRRLVEQREARDAAYDLFVRRVHEAVEPPSVKRQRERSPVFVHN